METFSVSLAICAGNSPVPGEFPTQRPVTPALMFFFYLRPNKRLSKQSGGWWFETPSRPLRRHCNVTIGHYLIAAYPMDVVVIINRHIVSSSGVLNIICATAMNSALCQALAVRSHSDLIPVTCWSIHSIYPSRFEREQLNNKCSSSTHLYRAWVNYRFVEIIYICIHICIQPNETTDRERNAILTADKVVRESSR